MTPMPTPLPITGRPVRVAVVGLGQVSELCLPPYTERDDVEIVGLCDRDPERVARWVAVFPEAAECTELDQLLALDADVVDVLVPTPYHADVVERVLDAGFHVQVQKPIARSLADAERMLAAAKRTGATLRVLEDYCFYPPLAALKEIVDAGDIGSPVGIHMKIVGTGRGGWDINPESFRWQWEQAADGRGLLTFDHGWHQLAVAHWLLGPITRVFGWIRYTQVAPDLAPDILVDAPATIVWDHANGARGVLDITLAPDTYFKSDYYTCDERVEVTGTQGYVRCNRISSRGVMEPAVVVYKEGEIRALHALDDDPPSAFRAQLANGIEFFRSGDGQPYLDADTAYEILQVLLTALDSSEQGIPLDVEPSAATAT
jgi:predicted dehydrogenase